LAEPHHVVVDGSNLATEGRTLPSLAQLDEAVRAYSEEDPNSRITVVVDASFEHRIDESERPLLREAMLNGEVVSPPAGAIGRGDAFALRIAERTGAVVLSNDSFQEFHGQHPWLFEEGRLVGGKPVPGVGWIFSPRLPIRGAKSRAATAGKGAKKDPESAPAKAAELAKAAKRAGKRAPRKSAAAATQVDTAAWPLTPAEPPPARKGRRRARPADPALSDAISDAVAEALDPPAPTNAGGGGSKKKKAADKKLAAPKKSSATKPTPAKKSRNKEPAVKKSSAGQDAQPAAKASQKNHRAATAPASLPARRRAATPLPAVNEPLSFITFVAAYPIGSIVDGEVVSYTSHGAMVDVGLPGGGILHCYIPLSAMGDPPPTKARQVLTKGVVRPFVLSGLDPPRRVAELSLPAAAPATQRGSTKKSATKKAATTKAATKKAPAKKAATKKAATKKAPAKKAATKKAPANKAVTKKAPATKAAGRARA
jgi:Zc3h12a-like Ribonuclease NYN domain